MIKDEEAATFRGDGDGCPQSKGSEEWERFRDGHFIEVYFSVLN